MKLSAVRVLLLVAVVTAAACQAAIIQPRPVDNRRDPHDGEPFEWEPVDDDPWPGPSFTFPRLPGIDEAEEAAGGQRPERPLSLTEARVRATVLMQLLRSVFNNNGNANRPGAVPAGGSGPLRKPVASNEVLAPGRPQQQKADRRGPSK